MYLNRYSKTGITSRGFYFFGDPFTAASNRGRLLIKGGLYFNIWNRNQWFQPDNKDMINEFTK